MSHPYHLLASSPWPAAMSMSLMSVAVMFCGWILSVTSLEKLMITFVGPVFILIGWWRDVIRESLFKGCHTAEVQKSLRLGVVTFIASEVMFFFSVFVAYFYLSLAPDTGLGACWPPLGVEPVGYLGVPMLNTVILLSSGVSITWAHHSLLGSKYSQSVWALGLTLLLAVVFLGLQGMEYSECSFTMADSSYGSIFFLSTGFHGMHVMVGGGFLMVALARVLMCQVSSTHHFGVEAGIWYWHFVDVVWLFLYLSVYWWSVT